MTNDAIDCFNAALSKSERKLVARLTSPSRIQAYLDSLPYRTDECYCCPLSVLRDRRAHCFDGALFGAAMLRLLGMKPMVVGLFAVRDDDHVLAVYRSGRHWGAIAKSNFVGLRFREPVYRSLRELVMSYFEDYYNLNGFRSLRGYTTPLNLRSFDRFDWMTSDEHLDHIADRLDTIRRVKLLTPRMAAQLTILDRRSLEAGMTGTDRAGLYKPD